MTSCWTAPWPHCFGVCMVPAFQGGSRQMRWARFEHNGTPTYGVVEGDEIIPVRGSPFDAWERTSTRLRLAGAKLLVPVVPPTFYAAGLNYAEHVREAAEKLGLKVELPTQPDA